MGKNSRIRSEARWRRPRPAPRPGSFPFADGEPDVDEATAFVEAQVATELSRMAQGRLAADLTDRAAHLLRCLAPLPSTSVRRVVDAVVARLVEAKVSSGWCPDDLDQLLVRAGVATDRSLLAAWLRADLRTSDPESAWREQVERFAPGGVPPSDDVAGLAAALHLGALLRAQPGLPTTITRRTRRSAVQQAATALDSELARKLATVRGLLAKAESTTYDEEAEALSAKAQELISRHALERLLESDDADTAGAGIGGPGARRIWVDAPYVTAKAHLVHQVARANASRSVLSEPPGVCTVVGTHHDLDAVELLVTSLLVQANAAMLRHGRDVDARGASRTRSFRASFLTAFAVRIGERLAETVEQVLHDSGHEGALLPALRSRDEAVEAAFKVLVPLLRTRTSTASNPAGWRAGHAAADLAAIDVRRRIAEGGSGAG